MIQVRGVVISIRWLPRANLLRISVRQRGLPERAKPFAPHSVLEEGGCIL